MDDTTASYVTYVILIFCVFECNRRLPILFNISKYRVNPIVVGFEAIVYQIYSFICTYLIILHDSVK